MIAGELESIISRESAYDPFLGGILKKVPKAANPINLAKAATKFSPLGLTVAGIKGAVSKKKDKNKSKKTVKPPSVSKISQHQINAIRRQRVKAKPLPPPSHALGKPTEERQEEAATKRAEISPQKSSEPEVPANEEAKPNDNGVIISLAVGGGAILLLIIFLAVRKQQKAKLLREQQFQQIQTSPLTV